MQYQVIEEITQDTNINAFHVVETASGRSIKQFPLKTEAVKLLRFLNLGGGFDGWSPSFFLKKIDLTKKKSQKVCINNSR